jgi:hypothetical protein
MGQKYEFLYKLGEAVEGDLQPKAYIRLRVRPANW